MLAGYNTRRSSVVLNPRGRVLGGLGGGYEGEGTGADYGDSGGQTAAEAAFDAATAAAANATAAAAAAVAFSNEQMAYEAASLAASNAAAFAASQIANEAALLAAANTLAANRASTRASLTTASKIAIGIASLIGGPIAAVAGLVAVASGAVDKAIEAGVNGRQLSYDGYISDADQALEGARRDAGDNAELKIAIKKVQSNLDAAKMIGTQAAVTQLYRTYAKRDPDPASLAYWSNAFGPTVTADEVFAFQEALYRNEPNLRPVVVTTQTTQTATQPSSNLALPIIAAVAGFLIFGG